MDRFYNCQMNLEIGANMQFGNLTCALSLIWQLQQIQLEICGNTFCIWLCIVPEDQLLHILAGQALLWVSSPILLAFADCNRAIINIEIFKPKNLCEVSVWSGRQECFSVTLPNRHPRPKGHIRDISKTAFDVNFLRYQKYRRYIADVDF